MKARMFRSAGLNDLVARPAPRAVAELAPTSARERIGSCFAFGCIVAFLTYAVVQLAASVGWQVARTGTGAVPLFVRWQVGIAAGAFAAIALSGTDHAGWRDRICFGAALAAGAALVVVVALAP